LPVRQTLGRYRIIGELGRGAMGIVYRAVDPLIEREVAIKTLLSDLPEDILAEVRERFLREARSAGRLNHPSIVTIFDVGEHEGVAYIAMELLEGRSLQQITRSGEQLAFATIADLVAQVADALDHAQRYSIVHRDVKPANIMVDAAGRAKLTDFGVAHIPASSMTQTGATLGSPRYMSPEQVLGLPPDPRSDLFSLGVVLYEMLTGRNPFMRPNDTAFSLMHRVAGEPHMPLREAGSQVPGGFERIVERALAKKPERRYQRAAEMASDLRSYKGLGHDDTRTQAVRPASRPELRPSPPAQPPAGAPHNELLSDLDKFVENFDREEQARAAEEARLLAEEQARRRRAYEAAQAPALPKDEPPRPAAAAAADPQQDKRRAALELIQKRASARPAAENSGDARARAVEALDRALRDADRYLAEIVGKINSAHPATDLGYDFLYLGRVPSVSLSEGHVFSRSNRVEGYDVWELIKLTYRAAPRTPHVARLQGAEIERCLGYLKSLKVAHTALAEQRNDFGQTTKAQITVTGALPCEVNLRGDYQNLTVAVELEGVRRIGKYKGQIAAAELEAAVDELVHYILGADSKFEKRVQRAP
jgi:serine/threonine protein kinase